MEKEKKGKSETNKGTRTLMGGEWAREESQAEDYRLESKVDKRKEKRRKERRESSAQRNDRRVKQLHSLQCQT